MTRGTVEFIMKFYISDNQEYTGRVSNVLFSLNTNLQRFRNAIFFRRFSEKKLHLFKNRFIYYYKSQVKIVSRSALNL